MILSLSDLLHLVSSPGPSVLLQMALFHCFYGRVVSCCVNAARFLCPSICPGRLGCLLSCLCEHCCCERTGACIVLNDNFVHVFLLFWLHGKNLAGSYFPDQGLKLGAGSHHWTYRERPTRTYHFVPDGCTCCTVFHS